MFACLDRYRASDHVSRGVVMKPAAWLLTGHRDKWLSDWPKPSRGSKKESIAFERLVREDPDYAD